MLTHVLNAHVASNFVVAEGNSRFQQHFVKFYHTIVSQTRLY